MNWNQITTECLSVGLTQAQLAEKIGVSQFTISQLSTGKQKSVDWEIGERLRAAHIHLCKTPKKAA